MDVMALHLYLSCYVIIVWMDFCSKFMAFTILNQVMSHIILHHHWKFAPNQSFYYPIDMLNQ